MEECKATTGGIKSLTMWPASDWKMKDGKMVLKRKYGKFTRRPIIHEFKKSKSCKDKN